MRAAGALVAVATLAGCGDDIAFRHDPPVTVTAPVDGSVVSLPVAVSWAPVDGPAPRYAAFVDRAPMPPGRDLGWLARDDRACRTAPGCPDESWLNAHAIYTTSANTVVITAVPSSPSGARTRSDEGHQVTIVALDEDGRRNDEHAVVQRFFVDDRP